MKPGFRPSPLRSAGLVCVWVVVSAPASAGPDVYGFGQGTPSATITSTQTVSPATRLLPVVAGLDTVEVDDATDFPVGTLVFLHQTTVASTYTPRFGQPSGIDVTANGVAHHELARVVARNADTLTLDAPLENTYTAGAQLVRVEEYGQLTIDASGLLQGAAYDGVSGGALVVFVDGDLVVDGELNMTGRGFRGGDADPVGGYITQCNGSSDHPNAAFRGGGAGGFGTTGVGSLANGGGGANCANGGGGGGGGAGGGGRGGQGHDSETIGGWGGGWTRPEWRDHLAFGGGGGSGDDNIPPTNGEGADGGGLIWVRARSISGSGEFVSTGVNAAANIDDGAGGGGAGGTLVLQTLGSLDCGLADVRGGNGGDTTDAAGGGLNGPGAGGGGGRIVLQGSGSCPTEFSAGSRGTAFDPEGESEGAHGSSPGEDGQLLDQAPDWTDEDGDGVPRGPAGGPDCDDTDPDVNPDIPDDATCDGVDDECDGVIDEDAPVLTVFPDGDGDGFGAPSGGVTDCAVPSGFAANPNDCDDGDPDVNPGEMETCNGVDDNCSGAVDEGVLPSWYADDDGDGAGDFFDVTLACDPPPGTVDNPNDCDDNDDTRFPGAPELCDGIDNDCDTDVDEGQTDQPWYLDADADGFGSGATAVMDCAAPAGYVDNPDDCNDQVGVINPDAEELCNQLDDDCDGDVDEGSPNASTWYLDADGDGRGDDATATEVCTPPSPDHVLDGGDCDDANSAVAPGLLEVCDGVDNDCDGLADDDDPAVTMLLSWYEDGDGDGVGDGPATMACIGPSGSVDTTGDCDDDDPAIVPGADEVCDSIDNDCDGLVDDADTVDEGTVWYEDLDGDGVGGTTQDTSTCNGGPGLSLFSSDCDDTDPDVFPGAPEPCEGVDTNCDGTVEGQEVFADVDEDGFGDPASPDWTCNPPGTGSGVVDDTDCDDTDASVNPDAVDPPGDGIDQDCDGADGVDTAEPVETADTGTDPRVPTGDTGSGPVDAPVRTQPTGCGCSTSPSAQSFWAVVLLGGLAARRRRPTGRSWARPASR